MRLAAVVIVAVVAVGATVGYVLLSTTIGPPATCPLEFGLRTLNTTYGWFYAVDSPRGIQDPLGNYSVTIFTFANESRVIEYSGPLTGLLQASGNLSFEDRGSAPGYLDAGGDYFWTRTWYNVWVYRGDQLVGGTVACA